MLVLFRVANFLSFKNLQEFSMIPGKPEYNVEHIYDKKIKILDRAVIYGPNSAGKSNFINAMAFAQWIAIGAPPYEKRAMKIFEKMNYIGSEKTPAESYFEFNILLSGKLYSYGFEYNTQMRLFSKEWLSELNEDGSERIIFNFSFNEGDVIKENNADPRYGNDQKPDSPSFLSQCKGSEIRLVFRWFKTSLIVLTTKTGSEFNFNRSISKESFLQIMDILWKLDTGIDGLQVEDSWGNIALDNTLRKGITHCSKEELDPDILWKKDPIDADDYDTKYRLSHIFHFNLRSYGLDLELDRIITREYFEQCGSNCDPPLDETDIGEPLTEYVGIRFTHAPTHFTVPYCDESEGTKKVVEILLALFTNTGSSTVVYDEFECSIHTLIMKELIKLLKNIKDQKEIQFITTTHESRLLKRELYRNDEIWFIDSDRDNGSTLYSLEEFSDADDESIDLEYLDGRFGAIPHTHPIIPEDPE